MVIIHDLNLSLISHFYIDILRFRADLKITHIHQEKKNIKMIRNTNNLQFFYIFVNIGKIPNLYKRVLHF